MLEDLTAPPSWVYNGRKNGEGDFLMEIRRAHPQELDQIMEIYDRARQFMRRSGNLTQWANGYPSRELIEEDMAAGNCYVLLDGGALAGTFCYLQGKDVEPTYAKIDGAWLDDGPYGVIHRLASAGSARGLTDVCRDWCLARCPSLRADTHRDNLPMQRALERCGFQRCGTVIIQDGTERLAYQLVSPRDGAPALERIRDYRSGRNRFARRLGIEIEELAPGWARVSKTVEEEDLNPLDRPHGAVYFAMADTAAGTAMAVRGYAAVTMESSFHFFRAARVGDRLTAEAREIKSGRTICVYDVRVEGPGGTLIGTGTFTFYQLDQRLEL